MLTDRHHLDVEVHGERAADGLRQELRTGHQESQERQLRIPNGVNRPRLRCSGNRASLFSLD